MRHRLDGEVRRFGDDGRVVLGGDPVGLLRLSTAGATALDRLAGGDEPSTPGEISLTDRLAARGVLVPDPVPGSGPFRSDDVTVVVPVRDDAAGVARLLGSLRLAGDTVAEVVVVDDGSFDPDELEAAVSDAATDLAAAGVAARVVRRDRSGGPAAARNTGAAAARTALLAFLDADCTVTAGWLELLLGHFADDRVAVVAPRVVATRSARPGCGGAAVWGHDRVRSPLDMGERAAGVAPGRRVSYVPSAAMVVRADRLALVGGFDESLRVGEDVDLLWHLCDHDQVVRYEPSATVGHEVRPDLASFVTQRVAYGSSAALLDERHPGRVTPARLSRWSAGVAAGLLIGGPAVPAAVALVAWTSWRLRDQLDGVPAAAVLRVGVGGHWSAVRQLLRASLRVWWPLLVVASPWSRRARRVLGAALVLASVEARNDGVTPGALPLALLDDVAYGAGVWRGCLRRRSFRALRPSFVHDR